MYSADADPTTTSPVELGLDHIGDITVLALYFLFVIIVGLWVSAGASIANYFLLIYLLIIHFRSSITQNLEFSLGLLRHTSITLTFNK